MIVQIMHLSTQIENSWKSYSNEGPFCGTKNKVENIMGEKLEN